ncbi:hypothetical protein [Mycobacterium sp. 1245805.9]|uniref:hypothetical protein n=1 Tax=Mycobacterium sp. 1245805.9 TaxID=1856862 RepID=UPI0012E9DFC3|nr:hypothetical protein [Mycobacterium sp. 1245805.9]
MTLTNNEASIGRIAYLRQLALDSLKDYSGGFVGLERVDRDLKSIIRSLEEVADPSWTNSLLRQWGQLEIIYALILDEGRFRLTHEEEADVREIIATIRTELQRYEPPSPLDAGEVR